MKNFLKAGNTLHFIKTFIQKKCELLSKSCPPHIIIFTPFSFSKNYLVGKVRVGFYRDGSNKENGK